MFDGEVVSSEEGEMRWVEKAELANVPLVEDFDQLLQVMLDDRLNEFQYLIENDEWKVRLR